MPPGAPLVAAVMLSFLAAAAAVAQTGGPTLDQAAGGGWRPGEVVERVACLSEPAQTYSLYLPPGYDVGRVWPVVFLMDPRGRAGVPLSLFREAAGRLGYILVSSYDTASDGPRDTNAAALTAILADARLRLSVDNRRLYLAGFSGTARAGWDFSVQLAGKVAGLMGFGGGLPAGITPSATMTFGFFGGAGMTDFNYEEMRALEIKLAAAGLPHRFAWYDGPHSWPSAEVCAKALDWMELRAVKSGLRANDAASGRFVQELFTREVEAARALETAGDLAAAHVGYQAIARDYEGLRDVSDARAKTAELGKSAVVRTATRDDRRRAAAQRAYETRFGTFLSAFRAESPPPSLEESLKRLGIEALMRRAASKEDPEDALAARRLLELTLAHTSFYEPRDLLERNDPGRALGMLKIAAVIEPDRPGVLFGMARARAQLGQTKEALELLARLAQTGAVDAATLAADPYLESLKNEAEFKRILERLGDEPRAR